MEAPVFNDAERVLKLKRLVNLYLANGPRDKNGWLDNFEWEWVPVTFSEDLPRDVLGMYILGKITLMKVFSMQAIFPIYIHELRHRWQWKTKPLKYLLGKIWRPIIENDAVDQQQAAEAWMDEHADQYRHID